MLSLAYPYVINALYSLFFLAQARFKPKFLVNATVSRNCFFLTGTVC